MNFNNVSLAKLIELAYDVKDYQISGPDWMFLLIVPDRSWLTPFTDPLGS